MKAAVIVLVAGLVAWVAYGMLTQRPAKDAARLVVKPEQIDRVVSAVRKQEYVIPTVKAGELLLVRGYVTGRADGALLVDAVPDPEVASGAQWNVDASAGTAEIQSLAEFAIRAKKQAIEREFGKFRSHAPGVRENDIDKSSRAFGKIAVSNHPEPAAALNLIVAPTDEMVGDRRVFSAKFQVESNRAAVATPAPLYPAGVDTPEERREYLKAIAEAKKSSKPASIPTTAPRDRGY